MKFLKLIMLAAMALALPVLADEGKITATGMAKTYNAAVNDALTAAVKQRNGVAVTIAEAMKTSELASSETATVNGVVSDQASVSMADDFGKDVQIKADGSILGYTVLSKNFNAQTGMWEVEVEATFKPKPGEYKLEGADDPSARRRMAVNIFRPHGDTVSVNGETLSTVEWCAAMADKLNTALSQTRKFTMLDRHFDAEIAAELARISGANADPADVNRLGKQMGTDYLVVGEVRFADVLPPPRHPVTRQVMAAAPQLFAEISYRVLLAPTGQLKWSGVVKLDTAKVPATDTTAFLVASTEAAATMIADEIMADILPLEIVSFKNGIATIGQGGNTVAKGQRYTVYMPGETVYDSRLGEAIGEEEIPVGTVEIIGVQPKLSYARVVGETAVPLEAGMILRPVEVIPVAPAPVAPPPVPLIHRAPSGGVVMPF